MARDDYIEVKDRVQEFMAKYPDGSLAGSWEWTERLGEPWIVYRAEAYRTPTDPRPGIGYAWEPVPGRTPFTRDSELMVAETSAWGRALAALGIAVHRGIATGDEVRNARARQSQADYDPDQGSSPRDHRVSAKQLSLLKRLCDEAGHKDRDTALAYLNATLVELNHPTVASVHLLPKEHASAIIQTLQNRSTTH